MAIAIHNFPEGTAVGTSYGCGETGIALAVAISMGLHNIAEGMACALPLAREGYSRRRVFWYTTLAGLVTAPGGLFGALAVTLARVLLPYGMAFAAGAMLYVVLDEMVPECSRKGHQFEAKGRSVKYIPDGNWTGEISIVEPNNNGIKETITLDTTSDGIVAWKVVPPPRIDFVDGQLLFKDTDGTVLFWTEKPYAEDANKKTVSITTTFVGNVLTYTCDLKDAVFPVTLDPTTNLTTTVGGNTEYYGVSSWATTRDATTAIAADNNELKVGANYDGVNYRNKRTFLKFPVSIVNLANVSAATLYLNGNADASTTNFNIYVVKGTQTGSISTAWYNDFTGWVSGSAHTPTYWSGAWNTSSYSAEWNTIPFIAAGLTAIQTANNDTLRVVLLENSWDIPNTAPTNVSYVFFEASTDAGTEPYLTITYTASSGQYTHFRNKDGVPLMLNKDGVPVKLWGR